MDYWTHGVVMNTASPMSNADVRAHVLREFYDQEMHGQFRGFNPADFAGRMGIPARQVEVALKYLVDMGLLNGRYVLGTDVPVVFGITALGMDLVDSPRKFANVEINQQIVQISGDVYAPITQAQNAATVTQDFGNLSVAVEQRQDLSTQEKKTLMGMLSELSQIFQKKEISLARINEILAYMKKYTWLYPVVTEIVNRIWKTLAPT